MSFWIVIKLGENYWFKIIKEFIVILCMIVKIGG